MTFKKNVVLERLAFLKKVVEELQKMQSLPKQNFQDEKERWALEHGLHLAAEAIFDIGNHILAGHFGDRPSNYEEILPQLAQHGVIPKILAERFQRLGGFRNILVHDYLKIDFEKVYDRLQNGLGDFQDFVKAIARWIDQGPYLNQVNPSKTGGPLHKLG